jgi:sterol desaturase/sphingolipid hydroxylase (fatty acid hydroxylase superfamily)
MNSTRSLLSWLVFPLLLAAVAAGSLALLHRLPPPAVSLAVLVALIIVISGLERLVPQHRGWNGRPEGLDLFLIVFNRLVDVGLVAGTLALAGGLQRAGVPLRAWPGGAPLLAQALLGITLAEGIRYVLHRRSHRPGLPRTCAGTSRRSWSARWPSCRATCSSTGSSAPPTSWRTRC